MILKGKPRLTLFVLLVLIPLFSSCISPGPGANPTPEASPSASLTPSATLIPAVYLSGLEPVSAIVGFGLLGRGVYEMPDAPDFDGKVIHAHGQDYPHGLMAHAPSQIDYNLNGQYSLLRTQILRQDEMQCGDGVDFQVFLDGKKVYDGLVRNASDEPRQVELDIHEAHLLSLVVDELGGGDCDWAIWGDPQLVPVGGVVADYPTATLRPMATIDLNLPCNGVNPDRIYLFLDCNDIRRIRADLYSGDVDFLQAWHSLVSIVDGYRANFPTSYDTDAAQVLWWGSSNYVARDMALIYLVTGEQAYAEAEVRLLDLVISHSSNDQLFIRPAHGEVVYQSVLFGYLVVRDLPAISEDTRAKSDRFFIRQGQLLEAASAADGQIPLDSWINRNVPMGENTSALTIALAFPEDPDAQRLYQQARARFDWQMANWIEQDGGWGENTNWYGHRVLEGILLAAETLRKTHGEDLYDTDFGGKSIHTMCTYFLKSMTPIGDPPQINDTGWNWFDPGVLLLCRQRTNDADLLFGAQLSWYAYYHSGGSFTDFDTVAWWDADMDNASPPSWTSVLLPTTGLGIFRSDWSREAEYGLLKYTSSAVHSHYSFGEFFLYDHGPWLLGAGYHLGADYELSVHTTSSSTLTLDDARQSRLGGDLVLFEPLARTGAMAVRSASYSILTHTRWILWMPDWHQWIVVDDATLSASPSGHRLQVRWFVRGQELSHDNNGNWTFTRPDYPGYLTIQMPSILPATYTIIRRSLEGFSESDAGGVEIQVAPTGADTRLVSVLTYSGDRTDGYPLVSRTDQAGGLLVTTQPAADSPSWDWLLASSGGTGSSVAGYSLTGQAGCTWARAADLQGYCLYAGTAFASGGLSFATSDQPVSLEADFDQGLLMIDSPSVVHLVLYWPSLVGAINENDLPVSFTFDQGYLTMEVPAGHHSLVIRP
jgi:hypothetical protein